MVESVDEDEKVRNIVPTLGGNQEAWMLTENGLYEVFMLSRKPIAKQLKKGIKEMLHSVRLHGAYMTDEAIEKTLTDPDYLIQLATTLKVEKQKRLAAERKIEEQKPSVVFAGAVETSKTSILIGELATILKQNGINLGANRLFEWMRGNGYLIQYGDRKNRPTQRSMDMGLFEVLERTIQRGSEEPRITRTTKVTGKGQVYFVNKFLNK
jgi:anti-repressor protein